MADHPFAIFPRKYNQTVLEKFNNHQPFKFLMKKSYLRFPGLVLGLSLAVSSCISDSEVPVIDTQARALDELVSADQGGENLRMGTAYNYTETFENQLMVIPYVEDLVVGAQAYFPGVGKGMANRMGKATSFLNQLAVFDPQTEAVITVAAPVTQFYGEKLEALGLTGIPDEVSSLTTDGKGNAIWFKNIKNVTKEISATLTEFEAEVEVIGGNGRFSRAKGQGVVVGTFNPLTGQGKSELKARIENID